MTTTTVWFLTNTILLLIDHSWLDPFVSTEAPAASENAKIGPPKKKRQKRGEDTASTSKPAKVQKEVSSRVVESGDEDENRPKAQSKKWKAPKHPFVASDGEESEPDELLLQGQTDDSTVSPFTSEPVYLG